jgi:predicted lipid-binding transport protein (Tim44 family)
MYLRCIVFFAVLFIGILALGTWDADAARFGGGKSFGGSKSMSKPAAPPPSTPGVNRAAPGQAPPGAAGAAGAAAPSRFGGMGGMLGGLLAGTLIGSLLFGGGFAGGGFMDILLIGLLLFLAFKIFSRFRRPAAAGGPDQYQSYQQPEQTQRAGMDWGKLSGQAQGTNIDAPSSNALPADFDSEEFLRGAKMAYTRLQASWDKRDLEDIAQFASPAVLQEVRAQAEADPAPSTTEVLLINARVLSVAREGGTERATVYFDVLLREDAKAQASTQVREMWHFMRNADEAWKLDGIQQVEGAG